MTMKQPLPSISNIRKIIDNNDPLFLENLAQQAHRLTEQYFGRTVSLYAPLYLSNYCSSYCTYCGFHARQRIERFKLTSKQMQREMQYLSGKGIENILLLTGESYKATPLDYILQAVHLAKKYFSSISIEMHPMETEEYVQLFELGVDGLTIYQETYDRPRYQAVHLAGKKSDYDFRRATPARAASAGFRSISLGILLGLHDAAEDLLSLYTHLREMEQAFPGVEYSISFPRLRSIKGINFVPCQIDDKNFIRIICLTRTLFPRVGINLSTREKADFRDHAIGLGVTRLSAESCTAVGGYTLIDKKFQNPQFDINDDRSVADIVQMLKSRQYDPVLTDWRRIDNHLTNNL